MSRLLWIVGFLFLGCSPDLESTCTDDQDCEDGLGCRLSYCVPIDGEVESELDAGEGDAHEVKIGDWCEVDGKAPEGKAPDCPPDQIPLSCEGLHMGRCVLKNHCEASICESPLCGIKLTEPYSFSTECHDGEQPYFCNGHYWHCVKISQCETALKYCF